LVTPGNSVKVEVPSSSNPGLMPDSLPEGLRLIWNEVRAFQQLDEERNKTQTDWQRQVERVRHTVPSACVEDGGETVRLGALSPGCVACKSGRWDCIFVTNRCNLDCVFCLRPTRIQLAPMYSALGRDVETLCDRCLQMGVTGVSFSGGEPFLDPEPVLWWLGVLRRRLPNIYIWAYTNGLTLSAPLLAKLAHAGLDELRFNMAAAGFRDRLAGKMLYEAVGRISAVSVEIPAIPEYADCILDSLHEWAGGGVKYLNLHELIYQSGSNSESMDGIRVPCVMPDGHPCAVNPRSSELIMAVLERAAADRLPLGVNECSMRSKARQMRGRRRMLAPFVLRPYERMCGESLAESACLFDSENFELVNVAELNERRQSRKDWHAALLRRQLPLDVNNPGQWVHFELIPDSYAAR
jgi:pyruvate formate-lyase activating enzyme-like uncharacterized protein